MPRILMAIMLVAIVAAGGCSKQEATSAAEDAASSVSEAATDAAAAAEGAADATVEQVKAKAQQLIQQVETCIKDQDFDKAKTTMDQLTAMKDSLPDDVKKMVAGLQSKLDAAMKAAQAAAPTGN